MGTYAKVMERVAVTVPDHLVADAEVPVLTGPQRQGDVGIFPTDQVAKGSRIPKSGIQVVVGEATGNTHWLHGDGTWAPARDALVLGTLTVPEGGVAYLIHTDEHGCNGIGAGTYRVTGKREQADEVRRVAD